MKLSMKFRMLTLSTNQASGWSHELHVNQGNVCLSDGSVRQLSTADLQEALKDTGTNATRLSMP